jgi:hypothetical protein
MQRRLQSAMRSRTREIANVGKNTAEVFEIGVMVLRKAGKAGQVEQPIFPSLGQGSFNHFVTLGSPGRSIPRTQSPQ